MSVKKIITAIVVPVVVLVGIVWLISHSAPTPTPTPSPEPVGSVASPVIPWPYYAVGDVYVWKKGISLATATNTPCAIQAPAATSTLNFSSLQITTGTSTAVTFRVATSTSPNATTTSLNYYSLASGAQGAFTLTSTTSNAYLVVAPNVYVVWGVEGTVISDATKLLGTCDAVFTVL